MKIAIITLPLHTNYGGILQAYALQTILEKMGNRVTLLEPKKTRLHKFYLMPLVYVKRFIRKYIFKEDVEIFRTEDERTQQYTRIFIKKYLHIRYIKKWESSLSKDFDAFVVGSDQIWRPYYSYSLDISFLKFLENVEIKRIAYAVSFGTSKKEFTQEQITYCKPLVKLFKSVSVREDSGVSLCENYFDKPAVQVLDPTLLLSKDDYIKLLKTDSDSHEALLLVYILDQEEKIENYIKDFAKKNKLKILRVNSKVEDSNAPIKDRIQPPLESWLHGFKEADFVITDSFHACAFSILFHKPFIVFGNKNRGLSRFTSLLRVFGLEKCLVQSPIDKIPTVNFDWGKIDEILDHKRKIAFDYIHSNLGI